MRRAFAVLAASTLMALGVMGTASADPVGYCSTTRGVPGTLLTVKGKDGQAGEWVHLNFSSKTIGGSTVDGFNFWKVSGRIPSHAVPGTYQISVTFEFSNTATPCFFRVVRSA